MSRISGRNTGPELIVRKLLYSLGYRYRLHDAALPGKPDIVFHGKRKVIFVHGCFWHGHIGCKRAGRPASNPFWDKKIDRNIERDHKNQVDLKNAGWSVLVLWQCELKDRDKLIRTINEFMLDIPCESNGAARMATTELAELRREFHRNICRDILGKRPKGTSLSNADDSSKTSVDLAQGIADAIAFPLCPSPPAGQPAGSLFTRHTMDFLDKAFALLRHLRPGNWAFSSSQARTGIASFFQYEHLADLKRVLDENTELKAALGGDYFITPDIMVYRKPLADNEINSKKQLVSKSAKAQGAKHTPLRQSNFDKEFTLLHASISCKWTMRSDRAQNTRTEALNLIRNRKGRTPNIMAVTFEPLPARIASIALGTGDIDCTYHGALYELMDAAKNKEHHDALEMLQILVEGRRLRDISDLPFDLAI